MGERKTRTVARSSMTGKFVSMKYAETHKKTTEVERLKIQKKGR